MTESFIRRFKARDYGCLKDVSMDLAPLQAFIGPNDSGKSTILRGVRTLAQLVSSSFERPTGPFESGLPSMGAPCELEMDLDPSVTYRVGGIEGNLKEQLLLHNIETMNDRRNHYVRIDLSVLSSVPDPVRGAVLAFRGARLVRFDPDALRIPSQLIPDDEGIRFLDERGRGLAGVYDAIRNRGDEAFAQISDEVRKLFPVVKHLRMSNVDQNTKAIGVELVDGTQVPASLMSEGLLFFLGFAALDHLEPTSVLLLEEPENGLHPARIAEVMRVLREISTRTQVLLATHSPLVVNELEPEEVLVVTRDKERGTKVQHIADTPNFSERSRVYALGELWLSYANGDDEAPLLTGAEPAR